MSALAHLDDERVRALAKHCLDGRLVRSGDVAAAAGVSDATYSRWANGVVSKSPKCVAAARVIIGEYFAGGTPLPSGFEPRRRRISWLAAVAVRWLVRWLVREAAAVWRLVAGGAPRRSPAAELAPVPVAPSPNDVPALPQCDISMCTWNLRNFGGAGTRADRLERVVVLLGQHDLVVAQEVLGTEWAAVVAPKLCASYKFVSGARTGAGSRTEACGVLYNADKLRLVATYDTATRRRDDAPLHNLLCAAVEKMRYKPFVATFDAGLASVEQAGDAATAVLPQCRLVTVVGVHVRYGESAAESADDGDTGGSAAAAPQTRSATAHDRRRAEIAQVARLCGELRARPRTFGAEVYVCGDFNMEPDDHAFWPLRALNMRECVPGCNKTTVAAARSSYDNVWVPASSTCVRVGTARVGKLDDIVDVNDAASRRGFRRDVSDHLPVCISVRFAATQ